MKQNLKKYIGVLALAIALSSCEKDGDQFLKDNITIIGHKPVITSFSITPTQPNTKVNAGANVKFDLRFWSEDEIEKINLNATLSGATNQVASTAYKKAYSQVSKTDSLILNYQVPSNLASGTEISMQVQVLNKSKLDNTSTLKLIIN